MTDGRDLVERMFAVIDGHRWDDYLTVMHPDVDLIMPQGPADAAGWVEFSQNFSAGFPDGRHLPPHVIQNGDQLAIEGIWEGTNSGPLATPQGVLPPTGAQVTLRYAGIATIRGDKLASVHVYFDQAALLGQLGLLPEPEPATA
jgi:predicted ester cyclase